jgi:hypothetical protein
MSLPAARTVSDVTGLECSTASAGSTLAGEALWEHAEAALLTMRGSSLIIFDWDDTLFPTTALAEAGCLDIDNDRDFVEEHLRHRPTFEELAECDAAAVRVLASARHVGNPIIVTDSDHGWVHETVARFLPMLSNELFDIPVISARSIFEHRKCSKQRKVLCFHRVAECIPSGVKSLVSIGDSVDEHEAAMMVGQSCCCDSKSFRLARRPTMSQLVQQLNAFNAQLPLITSHSGDLDVPLGEMVEVEGLFAEFALEQHIARQREKKNQVLWNKVLEQHIAKPDSHENKASKEDNPSHKKRRLLSSARCLGA